MPAKNAKEDNKPITLYDHANRNLEHKEEEYYPGQEYEGLFGWGSFTPSCLQFYNNPAGFLFIFSLFLLTQGILVNGFMNVILTTLERRFNLSSSETGLIVVSYDIGYFALCLFVTFYGNRAHRPRLLGAGSILFGLGCFLFAIPHFSTGKYVYEDLNGSDLCIPGTQETCVIDETGENLQDYVYLFVFAMLLQGIGCIPLYTVGFAVIEDSLAKGRSAFYIALANAVTILGPVIGYVLGAYLLGVYVDFDTVPKDDILITTSDPRWVGAWWVGYLLAGVMSFTLVSVPMLGFPKQLPGSAKIRAGNISEAHADGGEEITENEDFGKTLKDMPKSIITMLKNPTFLFTTLAGCSEAFIVAAFTAFLPKCMENQFNITAGSAALYSGLIAIPGGVFGNIIAGFVLRRFNMLTPQILKMCIAFCVVVFAMAPVCLMYCADPLIAGANIPYNDSDQNDPSANLTSKCNSHCNCEVEYFSPICGEDGITYFSSCIAGCTSEEDIGDTTVYKNCSCIQVGGSHSAVDGLCTEDCNLLIPFLAVFFFIVLFNFMNTTPSLLVIMRCVPASQKTFAVGLQWWIVRPLGSIPGPVVFGLLFDSTCVLWQELSCGEGQGSCWLHNSEEVAIFLIVTSMVAKAISTAFFSLALFFYKPPVQASSFSSKANINASFDHTSERLDDKSLSSEDFTIDNELSVTVL